MAEILGISCCCHSCHIPCLYSKEQGKHCHDHKNDPSLNDITHITIGNSNINDLRHLQRDKNFRTSRITKSGASMDCFLYSRMDLKSVLFIFFLPPCIKIVRFLTLYIIQTRKKNGNCFLSGSQNLHIFRS